MTKKRTTKKKQKPEVEPELTIPQIRDAWKMAFYALDALMRSTASKRVTEAKIANLILTRARASLQHAKFQEAIRRIVG